MIPKHRPGGLDRPARRIDASWRATRRSAALLALAACLSLPLAERAFADGAVVIPRSGLLVPPGWPFGGMFTEAESEKDIGFAAIILISLGTTLGQGWAPDTETKPSPAAPGPAPHAKSGDPGEVEGALISVPLANSGGCFPQRFAAVHPNQRLFYFATSGGTNGFICAYRFDPVAQALLPAPGSPFATGGEPADSLAIDPSGTFMYSIAEADSGVVAFSIDVTTGALTKIIGSPFPTAPNPLSVVVDRTGRFVYVATKANKTFASTITAYAIDSATGVLTPLPGSPYAVPNNAFALAMDPFGQYVYLTTGDSLQTYAVDPATGALKPAGSPVSGGPRIAVDPAGRFVYVESSEFIAPKIVGGVRVYKVEANGFFAAAGGFVAIGPDTLDVAVSRSGRHVYVIGSEEKPDFSGFVYTIAALKRDEATGTLTPIAGSPYPVAPVRMLAGLNVLPSQSGWAAGEPMFYPLGVSGGYPPFTWSVASGVVPPGLGVDITLGALRGTPTTPGIYEFVARVTDSRGTAATKAYRFTVAAPPAAVPVVEFYHAALDHFFITWAPDEIAKLDAGTAIKGWTRTGEKFQTYTTAQTGASPVCRYYIPPSLGDSHFFGRGTAECIATGQKNPSFVQESADFMQMFLPNAGTCPANTTQVYRVFSNRPDANHRYMTSKAIRDQMAGKGWLVEGDGPDSVVMCAPI